MIADCGHECSLAHIDPWDATTRCQACQDAREQAQWRQAHEEEVRAFDGDGVMVLDDQAIAWRAAQRKMR